MALCKNCGHEVTEGELICNNCNNPLADDVFDMDNEPIKGSYIMPGSPGYVPFDGIKVTMQDETPKATEENLETIQKIEPKQTEVNTTETTEEIIEQKEDAIAKENVNVPPTKEDTITKEAKTTEGSKRAADSGAYTPPKKDFTVPPVPPQQSGKSKKPFPIKAIGIGVVLLLVLVFLLGRGKGSKVPNEGAEYVGHWTSFACKYDGLFFDSEANEDIGIFALDLKDDSRFELDFDETFEGKWTIKDGVISLNFDDGSDATMKTYPNVIDLEVGETTFYFTNGKDSEFKTSLLEAIESQKAVLKSTEENQNEEEQVEPEEEPKETTASFNPEDLYGDYEGVLYEENAWGEWDSGKPFRCDIVGLIDRDTNTDLDFIEGYIKDEEYPFFSTFIELDDYGITPIIEEGSDDAYFYSRTLVPEEAKFFTKEITKYPPTLRFKYKFIDPKDPESGADVIVIMKPVGSSWDGEEIKPSGK